MSEENNKKIKVKMRVVAFSDLPKLKEISFKEIGVGTMKTTIQKSNREFEEKEDVFISSRHSQEELEREGNESLF